MKQTTQSILMVRPAAFGFNAETAASNAFQNNAELLEMQKIVQREFDEMVKKLREAKITVLVFDDTPEPKKPDAIFPNNWVSLHADGTVSLYPMLAKNRRLERRTNILNELQTDFSIKKVIDLTDAEAENKFLEGTGSIIFDHLNKTAFACKSPRTDENLLNELCQQLGYAPICFSAADANGQAIYHTNVLMAIGTNWAVCCVDAIAEADKNRLISTLKFGGRELIKISQNQMSSFAGNMLGLSSDVGHEIILLSESAFESLNPEQIQHLNKHGQLLPIAIPTIEKIGGGSVRCMVAEVFLPFAKNANQ